MNFSGWEIIIIFGVLLGLLLPVATLGFVLVKFFSKPKTNLKKCPYCAELIQPDAIVCRFCKRDLK